MIIRIHIPNGAEYRCKCKCLNSDEVLLCIVNMNLKILEKPKPPSKYKTDDYRKIRELVGKYLGFYNKIMKF